MCYAHHKKGVHSTPYIVCQFGRRWHTKFGVHCTPNFYSVALQKTDSNSITCPECRKTSALPSGGVKQLPNNFFVNRIADEAALKEKVTGEEEVRCDLCIREYTAVALCIDCVVFLCSHCHEFHKYSREYQGHSMSQLKELRTKKRF